MPPLALAVHHIMRILRSVHSVTPLLLPLILLISALHSQAQGPADSQGPIIKDIVVETVGSPSITKDRVLANLATKVGQPYSERTAEQDVRALYPPGGVSNVRIFAEPLGDGVKVTVLLQGRPVVEEVIIEGAQDIPLNRVRRAPAAEMCSRVTVSRLSRLNYYCDAS
jgi:outer membrane protein insertion porin family